MAAVHISRSESEFLELRSTLIPRNLDHTQMQFEGFDVPQAPEEEIAQIVPEHKRRKPRRNGQDAITIPEDLPVKTVILDIPEEEKICKETGIGKSRIQLEKHPIEETLRHYQNGGIYKNERGTNIR